MRCKRSVNLDIGNGETRHIQRPWASFLFNILLLSNLIYLLDSKCRNALLRLDSILIIMMINGNYLTF